MPGHFDRQSLYEEFAELVSIDSPSFGERALADRLKQKLTALGFEVTEDRAGEAIGGTAGNIYAFLKGTDSSRPAVLFSSHLDTVAPALGKRAVLHQSGRITSAGDTVLGADDAAGLVEILSGIRAAVASGEPRGDIELLIPAAEEVYTRGSRHFDFSRIKSTTAYVLDMSGEVGSAALQAPSLISFSAEVTGRAAHSGFAPEKGINALAAAAAAIAETPQGRLDESITFNIGTLNGGEASNIVPERCSLTGEARGFDHAAAVRAVEEFESRLRDKASAAGAAVEFSSAVELKAYRISEADGTVIRFQKAAGRIGIDPRLVSTHGGSDNHNIVLHGISGIVLSCGMFSVHSVEEYTTLEELARGAALVRELILDREAEK